LALYCVIFFSDSAAITSKNAFSSTKISISKCGTYSLSITYYLLKE